MSAEAPMRKVLIITYYWPPAGGPGVQRVLKFVKYLRDFGWEPIILTVREGEYPALDEGLAQDVPPGIQVFATRSIEFFSLFKRATGRKKEAPIETYILNREKAGWKDLFFTWLRQNVFLPDARVGWVPFAVQKGKEIIAREKPDLIFSSSPPHSLQLAAARLAKYSGIPWVADFRDPWTDAFWDKGLRRSAWAAACIRNMERRMVSRATALTSVSQGVLELLLKGNTKQSLVLPNGFDSDDFQLQKAPAPRFRIVYAGHIAASQNPVNFFEAVANLSPELRSRLDIQFWGKFDESVYRAIMQLGLQEIVKLNPYIPHAAAVRAITNADLLLLLIPRMYGKGILTGKVFEYLATGNYILGIGDPQGEAAQIVQECKAGEMFDYNANLLPVLSDLLHAWEKGFLPQADRNGIARYDRKQIAGRLADLFTGLCK